MLMLILQGVRGPSPAVPWQVRWTCSAWWSRGASGWVLGRLVEGQQKESSLVCKEQNLLQPASPGILPTLTVGHPHPGRSGQPGQEGAAQADLDDYNLPVNTLVMANYNAWHRSAYYWAEPDIFNPDHFLEEGKLINNKEGFPVCISTPLLLHLQYKLL